MRPMKRRTVVQGLVVAIAASGLLPVLRGSAIAGNSHKVEIKAFAFVPSQLKVKPGDEVTWLNSDVVPHTATGSDESWDTGTLEQGEQRTLIITEDTKADYFCRHHPSMVARLVID